MSAIPMPATATSIEFTDAIRATVREMGRVASTGQVAIINEIAKTHGRIDPETRTVIFDREDGTAEAVGEFLAREVGKLSQAPRANPNTGQKYTGLTAAAMSTIDRIRAQDEADALAHAQAVANGPNPWDRATFNQTRQAIIRSKLPQIAAQLKARAK